MKAKKDVEMRVERPLKSKNELYSYGVKVPRVELFDWKIRVDTLDKNKVKRTIEKPIKDIQAIYINPKWKVAKVGDR